MSFQDLGLSPKVLAAVEASGYVTPTPIQAQAIPHILGRRDVVGIAQTGTGKTAGFVLPMLTLLERGRARARMPRTLILEPTRELAAQVEEHFVGYGRNHKLTVALLIGGVSFDDQLKKLDRGVDVLIATPGRLLDHFERGKILMSGVEILVIDEADRMLDMGFIPDIERICKLLPFTRQTLMFSATMPPEIQRLGDAFLSNPVRVEASRPATAAVTVSQYLVAAGREPVDKRAVLRTYLRGAEGFKNAIIFCNRKRDVAVLHRSLARHGFNVGALHGDMDQRSRTATLDEFRKGEISLLVASDVAARGLDIPAVSHIINFDVPTHAEDYIHRIGRTGRAGLTGVSITIATPIDRKYVAAIEKLIGESIAPLAVEAGQERAAAFYKSRPGAESKPREREGRRRHSEGRAREPRRDDRPQQPQPVTAHEPRREDRPQQPQPVIAHEPRQDNRPQQPQPAGHAHEPRRHDNRPQQPQPSGHADEPRRHDNRPQQPQPSGHAHEPRRHDNRPHPEPRRHPRPDDRGRPRRDEGDGDRPVVGLGDHVPEFLLRQVKVPSDS